MRISDLSRQTGVSIATIKFYLRERLLPTGRPTGRNQADYDERHLRRLRLIRACTSIGNLDLSSTRRLLAAIEDEAVPVDELYRLVDNVRHTEPVGPHQDEGLRRARADADSLVENLGWRPDPRAPGRDRLAVVLAALRRLGCECGPDFFTVYGRTAEQLAVQELDILPTTELGTDRAAAVVRSVLLEVALDALRRLAQEHHAAVRFRENPAS